MTTPTILPCPFCGSEASLEDKRLLWVVRCSGCGACVLGDRAPEPEQELPESYWEPLRQSAVDCWNQRSAWQPIETALGDGTEVFVWDGAKAVAAVSERDFFGDVIHWPVDEWGDKRRDQPPVHGTHWQPQPSPPPITP